LLGGDFDLGPAERLATERRSDHSMAKNQMALIANLCNAEGSGAAARPPEQDQALINEINRIINSIRSNFVRQ
jgi:hypothetical protein